METDKGLRITFLIFRILISPLVIPIFFVLAAIHNDTDVLASMLNEWFSYRTNEEKHQLRELKESKYKH